MYFERQEMEVVPFPQNKRNNIKLNNININKITTNPN